MSSSTATQPTAGGVTVSMADVAAATASASGSVAVTTSALHDMEVGTGPAAAMTMARPSSLPSRGPELRPQPNLYQQHAQRHSVVTDGEFTLARFARDCEPPPPWTDGDDPMDVDRARATYEQEHAWCQRILAGDEPPLSPLSHLDMPAQADVWIAHLRTVELVFRVRMDVWEDFQVGLLTREVQYLRRGTPAPVLRPTSSRVRDEQDRTSLRMVESSGPADPFARQSGGGAVPAPVARHPAPGGVTFGIGRDLLSVLARPEQLRPQRHGHHIDLHQGGSRAGVATASGAGQGTEGQSKAAAAAAVRRAAESRKRAREWSRYLSQMNAPDGSMAESSARYHAQIAVERQRRDAAKEKAEEGGPEGEGGPERGKKRERASTDPADNDGSPPHKRAATTQPPTAPNVPDVEGM
ncbi:MAG: hypothetical protein M1838_004493 [Thelocarpon superellum]|nr:MAG: hypothetical protein M1838_004493 [Thelocarpon superellum]